MIVINAGMPKAGSALYFNQANDLLADPVCELERPGVFFGLDAGGIDFDKLYDKYNAKKLNRSQENYLHFNVDRAGRYLEVMSGDERALCARHFSRYLEKLGYPV